MLEKQEILASTKIWPRCQLRPFRFWDLSNIDGYSHIMSSGKYNTFLDFLKNKGMLILIIASLFQNSCLTEFLNLALSPKGSQSIIYMTHLHV